MLTEGSVKVIAGITLAQKFGVVGIAFSSCAGSGVALVVALLLAKRITAETRTAMLLTSRGAAVALAAIPALALATFVSPKRL
jgi:hypothetical protein